MSPMHRGRVLLVDDEVLILQAFTRVLRRAGFEVVVASDGVEGADLYERESFDVVVTDIHMPRLSGLDMLERIKSHDEDAAAIVLTGAFDYVDLVRTQNGAGPVFMTKPVENAELIATIEALIAA